MIHVWKALGLHFNNLQKNTNLQNFKYIMQNQGFLAKNVKKTKGAQVLHIWKARDPANTNMQEKFAKFSKPKCVLKKN